MLPIFHCQHQRRPPYVLCGVNSTSTWMSTACFGGALRTSPSQSTGAPSPSGSLKTGVRAPCLNMTMEPVFVTKILTHTHSLSLSLTHTDTHRHTHIHTHTHTQIITPTFMLNHTHTRTYTHIHTHITRLISHSHQHSHSHSHSHSQSPSPASAPHPHPLSPAHTHTVSVSPSCESMRQQRVWRILTHYFVSYFGLVTH